VTQVTLKLYLHAFAMLAIVLAVVVVAMPALEFHFCKDQRVMLLFLKINI
jgi:hypothetical protein